MALIDVPDSPIMTIKMEENIDIDKNNFNTLVGMSVKSEELGDSVSTYFIAEPTGNIKTEDLIDGCDPYSLQGEIIMEIKKNDELKVEMMKEEILEMDNLGDTENNSTNMVQGDSICAISSVTEEYVGKKTTEIFQCDHCDRKYKRQNDFTYHIKTRHIELEDPKPYLCDECAYRTDKMYKLQQHKITHSIYGGKLYEKDNNASYECEKCDYVTNRNQHLKKHLLVHIDASSLEMYKCDLCPYESKRHSNFLSHMITHKSITETKSYDCELCKYRTKFPHLLRQHIKTHKKIPDSLIRKCDKCDFQTNNKYTFENHVKKEHKIPKVYKCEHCSFQTPKSRTLRSHRDTHRKKEKIFQCYNCGQTYYTKSNLRYHILKNHLLDRGGEDGLAEGPVVLGIPGRAINNVNK